MVAYCYAIDNRDWDALDDVFTPEAIIDYTEMVGIKGNLKEIKAFLAESMKQISNSQHIISTTQLTVEGDRAQGRTICTNPMDIASNGHMMFVGLWSRDDFVRTPQGWQIGRAHVGTPVTNAHLVCRLLLDKTQNNTNTKN